MTAEIFGDQGLIVLAVILVVFFGGAKLPELARSLGRAKKEFSDGLAEGAATGSATPAGPPPATDGSDVSTSSAATGGAIGTGPGDPASGVVDAEVVVPETDAPPV